MKQKLITLTTLFTVLLMLAATGAVAGGKKYKIIFNEPFTRPHTLAEAANRFKELVEERSNGNISVKVHYGGVLGTNREALEAVKVGTQTMVDAATAPIVAYEPAMGVLNLPYLFSSRDQWYKVLDGPPGQRTAGTA